MSVASVLRQVFAMFYRPLVRLVDVLGHIGLGLLRGRVDIPGEFRFFGRRSQEASKPSEARAETAQPSHAPYPLVMETGDLPSSWDESTVILLPVNPYLIHAYWYVDSSDLESARGQMEDQRIQPALRFYDITDGVSREGARTSFDVDIQLEARNWYVHLWSPARSYYVDLGLRAEDGRFYSIARSNITQTPRAFPLEERHVRAEGAAARAETLPLPSPEMRAKAEASSVPGRDTEFTEGAEAKAIEESRPARQPLQSAQIPQSLEPGRQARFVAWGDEEEEVVADITANNERRLDFGVSSGQ